MGWMLRAIETIRPLCAYTGTELFAKEEGLVRAGPANPPFCHHTAHPQSRAIGDNAGVDAPEDTHDFRAS